MATLGTAPAGNDEQARAAQKYALEQRVNSAAKWFYWIAGLSVINLGLTVVGASIRFIFGMGITDIVLQLGRQSGETGTVAAVIVTLFIAGICAAFGALALKRHAWAFWVGMLLYTCDGLVLLLFRDFLGAAFHVYVLFNLFQGPRAITQLKRLEAMFPAPVTAKPIA